MSKKRAVFLDRDGCLNVEDDYITKNSRFRLYPQSVSAIQKLYDAGFTLVVITNQGGIAKGLMTVKTVEEANQMLLDWSRSVGAPIARVEYCPHHPEGKIIGLSQPCDCRKPASAMVVNAADMLDIDLSVSYVVGDKLSDIGLGATGLTTILVRTGFGYKQESLIGVNGQPTPDHICNHIEDAADWIIEQV